MVACEAFDPLVDLLVLLEVAALGELHVAKVTLEWLDLRVASHMRGEFAQREKNSVAVRLFVLAAIELVNSVAVGARDCVLGEVL